MQDTLAQLVALSRHLGNPALDYVILGEGNTSARADADTLWIKVSGAGLAEVDASSFVRVRIDKVLAILDAPAMVEQEVRAHLAAAKVDPEAPGLPSIETTLHALCLSLGGAKVVAHTHPTAVNAILCAKRAEEAFSRPILPAEGSIYGQPLLLPHVASGQPLAWAVHEGLRIYLDQLGHPPKAVLMRNHGLVALGQTADEVLAITAMMVKTAHILLGTQAWGGPDFLD